MVANRLSRQLSVTCVSKGVSTGDKLVNVNEALTLTYESEPKELVHFRCTVSSNARQASFSVFGTRAPIVTYNVNEFGIYRARDAKDKAGVLYHKWY